MSGNGVSLVCPRCQLPLVAPIHFLGHTIACSRCGTAINVIATPQPPAAPATRAPLAYVAAPPVIAPPIPPPVAAPPIVLPPGAIPAEQANAEEEFTDDAPQPRNPWLLGCLLVLLFLAIVSGMLGAIVVGVMLIRLPATNQPSAASVNHEEQSDEARAQDLHWWTDASVKSIRYAGVSVRVDRVAFESPRFQSRGEILTSTEDYLIVSLTVTNHAKPEVTYKSWYSYKFADEEGAVAAELIDDAGEVFELFPIPGADRVEKHIHSEYFIPQNDSISDSLVFKLPVNYKRDTKRSFKLSLPASAVEEGGFYRFKIPAEMVEEAITPSVLQSPPQPP